uniref:Uncharacterized protein n=1 Tax=Candidatus Kentrum sp. FW TaxID=2126338 RepID=A0A450TPL1_9GAMM|nr:MAG: hypothetical protein BECKFW1821B_GA0114236_11736 [Candidatus Kentron sp. FW]
MASYKRKFKSSWWTLSKISRVTPNKALQRTANAAAEFARTPNHTTYASLSPTDIKATQPAPANPKIKKIYNEIHRAYLRVYLFYPEVQSVYHEV